MSEQNKFLEELEQNESSAFSEQTPEPEKDEEQDPEEAPESVKDRAHRRLEAKLQAEREANIALNARLQAISESKNERTSEAAEYLKSVERIYGTNTPEAAEATELLKSALRAVKDEAKSEALSAFQEERRREAEETRIASERLESMIEGIEDENGLVMTGTMRTGFLTLLEKMSPKDSDGDIIEYADPNAVWEVYQSRRKDNRAKDIATRSMATSAGSSPSKLQDDATERYLKENGFI